jgi:hypothetical protein
MRIAPSTSSLSDSNGAPDVACSVLQLYVWESIRANHNLQHTARFGWLPSTCNCCGQGEITLAVSVDHDLLLLSLVRNRILSLPFEVQVSVSHAQP